MECSYSIKFVVALEAEAEPIIEDYSLKRIHEINLFKVYRNISGNHWLIISGIGCINAAAASIFLYQYSNANKSSFWFNIGIAGYFTGPAGEIFLVDKILDEVTCQTHFPRSALTKKIKRDELLTVSKPREPLSDSHLIDMEGFSFFDVVNRFAFKEMITVLKVVSDFPGYGYTKITKNIVRNLIGNILPDIREFVTEAEEISYKELLRLRKPATYTEIISKTKFTETQSKFLEKLVRDWEGVFPERYLIKEINGLKKSSEIVRKLTTDLNHFRVDWLEK